MTIETEVEALVPEVRAARWGVQLAIGLGVLAIAAFVLWWLFVRPAADHRAAVQAGIAAKVATAATATATDATATADKVLVLHDHSDTVTHENTTRILAAPGSSDALPPAVGSAWLAALCLRDAYQHDPACAAVPRAAAVDGDKPDAGRPDPG